MSPSPSADSGTAIVRDDPRIPWVVIGSVVLFLSVTSDAGEVGAGRGDGWIVPHILSTAVDVLALYVAVLLSRKYPIGRSQPLRHLGVHSLAAACYGMALAAIEIQAFTFFDPAGLVGSDSFFEESTWTFAGYWVWAAIGHGIEYFRRHRRSRANTVRLHTALGDVGRRRAEAELRALKAELNPHFLGTALGTVASLVRTDAAAAERMLAELGDMLRATISRVGTHQVTLGEELDSLTPLLALKRAGFGGQLEVRYDVNDATRNVLVPQMILHLLLESAIDYGFPGQRPTCLLISAGRSEQAGARLRVEVTSSGRGLMVTTPKRNDGDAAFARAQARLSELYGPRVSLELETSSETGAVARLMLPWKDEDAVDESLTELSADVAHGRDNERVWKVPLIVAIWFAAWFAMILGWGLQSLQVSGAASKLGILLIAATIPASIPAAMLYVAIRITRADPTSSSWRRHAIAALSFGVGIYGIVLTLGLLRQSNFGPASDHAMIFTVGPILYAIHLAFVHAIVNERRYRSSKAAAFRLRDELTQVDQDRVGAELRALKAELNPHFLGNALAAVSPLVRADPPAAERVLGELGALLSAAIARTETQEVTLSEELDGLAPFLAIERARFGDRLVVSWDVEAGVLDAFVPHMILQPLVENAVKHGFSPRRGAGRIVVSGRRVGVGMGSRLELSVIDDGVGLRNAGNRGSWRHGVGMANVRARLEHLYGDTATLELIAGAGAGTIARVTLPWREAVRDAPAAGASARYATT